MASYYVKGKKADFKKLVKTAGLLLVFLGFATLFYFFFPLLSYQLFIASTFSNNNIEVPIPKYQVLNNKSEITSLIAQGINSLTSDYTDARNWYPKLTSDTQAKVHIVSYQISIPKLKISNATVSTQDYDLDRHLVQYLGTSIPGENGTAVIFGHSTLPQLFNPANYKTIFATAHTLKIGDELSATVGTATYKYKIFSITITSPDDTNILSQSYDHSYITLVTCTPPGTIWKRLVIRAALES